VDYETIINEVISLGELRLARYKDLITLAAEQREILVSNKHEELLENLNRHEPVLADLAFLEAKQDVLAARLDEVPRPDNPPVGLEQKRTEIAAETAEAAQRLQELVRVNAELLSNVLNFVSFTVGLIAKLATNQQSYDPRNQDASGNLALVIDRMV
jgi:chemotaxis protein histidine kinase CheA